MKKLLVSATISAFMFMGVAASAYDVKVDEDTFAKVALKGQIQVQTVNGPAGADHVGDLLVPNARISFGGQVTNMFKFGSNFDMTVGRDSAGASARTAALADGFVMLDFFKELKVMTGVYRMAVSRFALQDSYSYILPTAPEVAGSKFLSSGLSGYRSGGVTLWGDAVNGMFRYNLGIWDGDYSAAPVVVSGASNREDQPGMSARFVVNLLDPEKGYTTAEGYHGKAKIANIGVGFLTQDYLSGADDRTYTVAAVDAFYDADGATGELGYFQYDYGSTDGRKPTGWFILGSYLIGKIQPALRYESWDDDVAADNNSDYTRTTAGASYLIEGHNAKIQLEYAMKNFDGAGVDTDTATLQLQVQF